MKASLFVVGHFSTCDTLFTHSGGIFLENWPLFVTRQHPDARVLCGRRRRHCAQVYILFRNLDIHLIVYVTIAAEVAHPLTLSRAPSRFHSCVTPFRSILLA